MALDRLHAKRWAIVGAAQRFQLTENLLAAYREKANLVWKTLDPGCFADCQSTVFMRMRRKYLGLTEARINRERRLFNVETAVLTVECVCQIQVSTCFLKYSF